MTIISPRVFSWLQASGVSVLGTSAVLVVFRRGPYGASTRRAGPPTILTASMWTSRRASGTALRSATGTRTSLFGTCQSGGAAFSSLSFPTSTSWGLPSASQHSTASRGDKSIVCALQTAPRSPWGYASSFPRNRLWSRRASSPAPRTV